MTAPTDKQLERFYGAHRCVCGEVIAADAERGFVCRSCDRRGEVAVVDGVRLYEYEKREAKP